MIKHVKIRIEDGTRHVSIPFTTLCGLASMAFVLVVVVAVLGRPHGKEAGFEAIKPDAFFMSAEDVRIDVLLSPTGRFMVLDGETRRFDSARIFTRYPPDNQRNPAHPWFLFEIQRGSQAGAIVDTIDELTALGYSNFNLTSGYRPIPPSSVP
ncbi:hypothetical protein ASA1KI_33490 [Opitutales bacterium ASA1]|uniref:hypothetical protein n=1 Tax=Congregicoccus parvus TaxID=3081749 RepID=UPI002B305DB4|nr:hypothetical protein ASA1KI_33490 [Opitutales bacterium ASA1]